MNNPTTGGGFGGGYSGENGAGSGGEFGAVGGGAVGGAEFGGAASGAVNGAEFGAVSGGAVGGGNHAGETGGVSGVPGGGVSSASASAPGAAGFAPEPARATTLEITHIDLPRALRLSAAVNAIIGVVIALAALLVFGVLVGMGAWGNLNSVLSDIAGTSIPAASVIILILIVAIVEALVGTVLGVLGAAIYNGIAATKIGGLKVSGATSAQ